MARAEAVVAVDRAADLAMLYGGFAKSPKAATFGLSAGEWDCAYVEATCLLAVRVVAINV